MVVESILSDTHLGSTIPQYVLFFLVLGAGALIGRSLSYLYRRRLSDTIEATETEIDDVIAHALGRPVMFWEWCSPCSSGGSFSRPSNRSARH